NQLGQQQGQSLARRGLGDSPMAAGLSTAQRSNVLGSGAAEVLRQRAAMEQQLAGQAFQQQQLDTAYQRQLDRDLAQNLGQILPGIVEQLPGLFDKQAEGRTAPSGEEFGPLPLPAAPTVSTVDSGSLSLEAVSPAPSGPPKMMEALMEEETLGRPKPRFQKTWDPEMRATVPRDFDLPGIDVPQVTVPSAPDRTGQPAIASAPIGPPVIPTPTAPTAPTALPTRPPPFRTSFSPTPMAIPTIKITTITITLVY
ncbi:MAG: hypothetical protein QF535_02415, partial [Anaerolineales bacterium]|nr:hypothetical protein [Anaerolineales bacterium]